MKHPSLILIPPLKLHVNLSNGFVIEIQQFFKLNYDNPLSLAHQFNCHLTIIFNIVINCSRGGVFSSMVLLVVYIDTTEVSAAALKTNSNNTNQNLVKHQPRTLPSTFYV